MAKQGAPDSKGQGAGTTEHQVNQWAQIELNKIEHEMKGIHSRIEVLTEKVTTVDKLAAVLDLKATEINSRLTEFKSENKTELREIKDSVISLKTTIARAAGAIAMLIFVIGIAVALSRFIPK